MLNLDEFKKTITTHQITLNGKVYTALPLSVKKLGEVQLAYNNYKEEDGLEPLRILFDAVGYPTEELLELPLAALQEVQKELFTSIQGQVVNTPTKKRTSKKS